MFQRYGDFGQLNRINRGAFEDAVDGGALQVNLTGQLRHGHPALVENGFDQMADMDAAWVSHGVQFPKQHKKGVEVNLA